MEEQAVLHHGVAAHTTTFDPLPLVASLVLVFSFFFFFIKQLNYYLRVKFVLLSLFSPIFLLPSCGHSLWCFTHRTAGCPSCVGAGI